MKPMTETEYIYSLIAEGEHQQQDFKFEISDIRKIAKSLSAFSNTDGGRLLIGVKDNGKIAGIRSEEEIYMIEAAAQLYCIPQLPLSIRPYLVEGKQIVVAEVTEQPSKPVYAKDENGKLLAYVRIEDENILATPVHLRVWRQAGKPEGVLVKYTEREQSLLNLMEKQEYITLNRCCKQIKASRYSIENLLAKFIRFGIIEPAFINHRFYFRLRK